MYDVMLIAKYIIDYCNKKDIIISNLKLQKILYFIQAQFLVSKGKPCFSEEIEAWEFGPVVPRVYRRYKAFGSSNIPNISTDLLGKINPNDRSIIDAMINKCAGYTASQLVKFTHNHDPWKKNYKPDRSNTISKQSIQEFYARGR